MKIPRGLNEEPEMLTCCNCVLKNGSKIRTERQNHQDHHHTNPHLAESQNQYEAEPKKKLIFVESGEEKKEHKNLDYHTQTPQLARGCLKAGQVDESQGSSGPSYSTGPYP